ncbi:MAG: phage portal protein family protein [Limisphaerales bacterium]
MSATLIHPVTGLPRKWPWPDRGTRSLPVGAKVVDRGTRSLPVVAQPAARPLALNPALQKMINPAAQYRWLGLPIASYTPDLIETILRGALMGNIVYVWQMYDLMEATWPRLQKNLKEIKEEVASLPWSIQPSSPKGQKASPDAVARADALDTAIWQMRPDPAQDECDFRAMIQEVLDAWSKGLSVVELLWDVDDDSQLIVPRAAQWVHPQNYGYGPDGGTLMLNIGGWSQGETGWQPFPDNKFLIGVAKGKSGHPLGGAMLRALAWWWAAGNFASEWFLNFAQIFGMPLRFATYDPTRPDLVTVIMDMLQNMGSAGFGAFPAGTAIELKEAGSQGKDNPQAAILDRADTMCDLLVLGETLTSELRGGGSRAAAMVHMGILKGRKKAAADWVGALLNTQFAPAFCRLNWGDDDLCPRFLVDLIEEQSALEMAQRDVLLLGAGVDLPKEWSYDRWGIPMPAAGDDVITRPAPAPAFGAGLPPGGEGPSGGPPEGGTTNNGDPNDGAPGGEPPKASVAAKDATGQLTDHVLENLTGVQARWLGGLKPHFHKLIQAALSNSVSDAQFIAVIERAQKEMPELFQSLDRASLAKVMEETMAAACVNGAVKGYLHRHAATEKGNAQRSTLNVQPPTK